VASEVPILDSSFPIVGVQKIGPSDVHQDDKRLGFEPDEGIVEDLDPSERRILGLRQELAGFRVVPATHGI
jgi:hypothetical protein